MKKWSMSVEVLESISPIVYVAEPGVIKLRAGVLRWAWDFQSISVLLFCHKGWP